MPFAVALTICLLFATILPCNGAEFSQSRDLPPLKLAAKELDAILIKTHSFIDAANGPARQGYSREAVKLVIGGHQIEIPHFSLASSVAFPDEIFAFSYTYYQAEKPISSVTIDLGDSSRRVSVSGESAEKVGELSSLLENDLRHYSTAIGGAKFRRVAGVVLLFTLLMSLMVSGAYCWSTRSYSTLGMPICSALGLMLVLLVPWHKFLPRFVVYQRYSPFFLVRHASQVFLLALLATLVGIPLSYFLGRKQSKRGKENGTDHAD